MPGDEDPECGGLVCANFPTGGFCTNECENNASQAMERSECGGAGSTCLTQGDPPNSNSFCTASCRVSARGTATGACRAGSVCTGFWYTHAMGADATGCFPFCSENSHCSGGMMCNTRRGSCAMTGADNTRLPDGSPCNPMMTTMVPGSMTPQNIQCRGICFAINSRDRTQGICGSLLNVAASTACPDDPDAVQALAPPMADNLAICIFKQCRSNADCRAPHICRFEENAMGMPATEGPTVCNYPTMAQPTGMGGDAGVADAAVTDSGAADAARADAPTGG
jgi:hypothetical protein